MAGTATPTPSPPSANSTSASYNEGQGVPQDGAAAVSWFRKAADQGHAPPNSISAACGAREVELWLFVKRDEAEAWAEG